MQMRCHRMAANLAGEGGWSAWTWAMEDPATTETILEREVRLEVAIVHVWDVIGSFENAIGAFQRRVEMERTTRGDGWLVSGVVVIANTGSNRRRLSETGRPVDVAFTHRGAEWLAALGKTRVPMPTGLGMIWTDLRLMRLRPLLMDVDFRRRSQARGRRPGG